MGRRPALDDIKRREVCAILSMGCSREAAAGFVGCAPITIARTAERDRSFREALLKAESAPEVHQLKHIHAAGQKNWRAAAWVLERKFPEQYARRTPGTVTPEQIARLLAEFAAVVIEEVPDPAGRKRILHRLDVLTQRSRRARRKRDT